MDISSARHLGHRRLVCTSVEDDPRNLFSLYFIRKDKNSLPCHRSSKYDAGKEIRNGSSESSDISTIEVLKLHAGECRTVLGRDRRGGFSNSEHLQTLSAERRDGKKSRDVTY